MNKKLAKKEKVIKAYKKSELEKKEITVNKGSVLVA